MLNKLLTRCGVDLLLARPRFQRFKVRRDQRCNILLPVADQSRIADEMVRLQLTLDRLRRYELPRRGLDELLLTGCDRQKTVLV